MASERRFPWGVLFLLLVGGTAIVSCIRAHLPPPSPVSIRIAYPEGGWTVLSPAVVLLLPGERVRVSTGAGVPGRWSGPLGEVRGDPVLLGSGEAVARRWRFEGRGGFAEVWALHAGPAPEEIASGYAVPTRETTSGRMRDRLDRYAPPTDFHHAPEAAWDAWVTPHFRLRPFLCRVDEKDDGPRHPWFLLDRRALVKLEAIRMRAIEERLPGEDLVVISGFRPPAYNRTIEGSRWSRHQYGDAIDFILDGNGDGMWDDLDGNGAITAEDLHPFGRIHGELEDAGAVAVGGCGLYLSETTLGSVHIDTRGYDARWGQPGELFDAWWSRTGY